MIILINTHQTQLNRDVPGIDSAHLAMDTEEGVEVVWNEVCYSNRKLMKGSRVCVIWRFTVIIDQLVLLYSLGRTC